MSLKKLKELDRRLEELGIAAADLIERFTGAGGPGGQSVNRTSSAVQLRHAPSGLETRAEGERSQMRNRLAAREQLIAKVLARRAEQEAAKKAEQEKQRRRRRKRPRSVQKRILESKRRRSRVKANRGRVRDHES